jgi:hypothetical protein
MRIYLSQYFMHKVNCKCAGVNAYAGARICASVCTYACMHVSKHARSRARMQAAHMSVCMQTVRTRVACSVSVPSSCLR